MNHRVGRRVDDAREVIANGFAEVPLAVAVDAELIVVALAGAAQGNASIGIGG